MSTIEALVSSAKLVHNVEEFKVWTKNYLRPVLPHESLLCGWGHLHAGGVGLDYLVPVDYPIEHINGIRNRVGAIDTPILRRWLTTREPVVFEADKPWPDIPSQWLDSFKRHDLKNVVAHAVYDVERCAGTYHSFYRIPGSPGDAYIETLEKLLPTLHEVMCSVINSLSAKDRLNERMATLTAREEDVLRWLSLGKTNAEIAELTGVSESTIKHHLTNVFDKLGVSNRAQLVRLLTQRQAHKDPGDTTQLL
jgi:DNA-binding CsgD family transcriptional regulator